jgi:uncharacterized protein YlxP (DUF503 family)
MYIQLRLHDSSSLKEKRHVLRSVKDRLRQRFNVALAEVGAHDEWRNAELGIVSVAGERRELDKIVEKISYFLDGDGRFDIVHRELEIS